MWRSFSVISPKRTAWCSISAQLISERTRLSLQVKKSQGVRLGKPENLLGNHGKAIANSVRTNKQKAAENENNRRASALIVSMRRSGNTYSQIARALNAQRFRTSQGCQFTPSSVRRLYRRSSGDGGEGIG